MSSESEVDAAWQSALAAEHRAAFGYPLLGTQLAGASRALAASCEVAHEVLRNVTMDRLVAAGLVPVAPLGNYPELYPARGATAARRLAVRLETDCAAAWRYLYAVAADTDPSTHLTPARLAAVRRDAQAALTASAVRATRWRRAAGTVPATVAFPGI